MSQVVQYVGTQDNSIRESQRSMVALLREERRLFVR